jgi:pimeloyl-ACP methyl ester carboxylesterase
MKARLEAAGFECQAPAWPYDDRPIADLRASPDPALATIGVAEILDRFAGIAGSYPEPPLLVGHSFGGLFVQLLLDRGIGRAGVAISPAPTRGVFPNLSALRANALVLRTWRSWKKTLTAGLDDMSWSFFHGLPEEEQRAAYEAHVIPTPGRPFWQVALAPFNSLTTVDYTNPSRPPLLIISGESDRTVPASINQANFEKWKRSPAETEMRKLPRRTHWIIAEPGWEEVADLVIDFARRHPGSGT